MGKGPGKNSDGKRGGLEPEDFRLWRAFTRDSEIEPLEEPDWEAMEREIVSDAPQQKSVKPDFPRPEKISIVTETLARPVHRAPQEPQLDARTELRLRRGQMPIQGRLDLHGYNQEQAHGMLNDFVLAAHAHGKRCLLIITGKGQSRAASREEQYGSDARIGILKQKLPQWLSMPPLRDVVLKTFPATPRDGGSGAWYLYLKRQRDYV